jgi:hypothetical protein
MSDSIENTASESHSLSNPQSQSFANSAIPNLVPGAEVLGYGFNIFGQYSFDSALRPLFDLGATTTPYTYPESGTVYNVPANVSPPGGSSATAAAYAFSSASEFVSQFQADASVSGSVGAFSGSFASSYSKQQQNSADYSWALVEGKYYAWHLQMLYSAQILLSNITSDPDWANLPSTFNANNAQAFYTFFEKFGTHFISGVACGGTLYYYFSVSKQWSMSANQISASASAEYQGLISSTEAQASVYWSQCTNNWAAARQSYAITVPATTGVIDWVNPPVDSYDQSQQFANWKTSVTNNPSRANFSLTPIYNVFSGAQATALKEAYAAYGSNRIHIESYRDRSCTILVNGTPIQPPGGYPAGVNVGWHMIVLDATNNNTIFNRYYSVDYNQPNWPDPTYDQMASDLAPYLGSAKYTLVLASCYMDEGANPNNNLYGVLKSFGAGAGLDQWMTREHRCSGGEEVAYALAGAGTSVAGCEAFLDTQVAPYSRAEGVTVDAFLQPGSGTFVPVPYQPN